MTARNESSPITTRVQSSGTNPATHNTSQTHDEVFFINPSAALSSLRA